MNMRNMNEWVFVVVFWLDSLFASFVSAAIFEVFPFSTNDE